MYEGMINTLYFPDTGIIKGRNHLSFWSAWQILIYDGEGEGEGNKHLRTTKLRSRKYYEA
jgi:hypothetical protein